MSITNTQLYAQAQAQAQALAHTKVTVALRKLQRHDDNARDVYLAINKYVATISHASMSQKAHS